MSCNLIATVPELSDDESDVSDTGDVMECQALLGSTGLNGMVEDSDCSEDEQQQLSIKRSSLKAERLTLVSSGEVRPAANTSLERRMEMLVKLVERPPSPSPPGSAADVSIMVHGVLAHDGQDLHALRDLVATCTVGDLEVLFALRPCLYHMHWPVRRTALDAFKTIARRGCAEALSGALACMDDTSHEVRESAVELAASVALSSNLEVISLLERIRDDEAQTFPVKVAAEEGLVALAALPLPECGGSADAHMQMEDSQTQSPVVLELHDVQATVPSAVSDRPGVLQLASWELSDSTVAHDHATLCNGEASPSDGQCHEVHSIVAHDDATPRDRNASTSCVQSHEKLAVTVSKCGWFPEQPMTNDSEDEEERRDMVLTRAALKEMATASAGNLCSSASRADVLSADGDWILA